MRVERILGKQVHEFLDLAVVEIVRERGVQILQGEPDLDESEIVHALS